MEIKDHHFPLFQKPLTEKVESGNRLFPRLHDFQQVKACIASVLSSSMQYICKRLA